MKFLNQGLVCEARIDSRRLASRFGYLLIAKPQICSVSISDLGDSRISKPIDDTSIALENDFRASKGNRLSIMGES
jgi:hypothetical protein